MLRLRVLLSIGIVLTFAGSAFAQGNPTGAIRGQVADPGGLVVPGVVVTVTSTALQGTRTAVTSANGDFLIPFLPPGEYTVSFAIQGFNSHKETVGVAMAETQTMKITLTLAQVSETVTVPGASSTEGLKTGTVAETYKASSLEKLPVGRTVNDAVLLAPA